MTERNNSVAELTDNNFLTITEIVQVTSLDNTKKEFVILGKKFETVNEHLSKYENFSSNQICKIVKPTRSVLCCYPSKLKSKCLLAQINNLKFVVYPLPNVFERD